MLGNSKRKEQRSCQTCCYDTEAVSEADAVWMFFIEQVLLLHWFIGDVILLQRVSEVKWVTGESVIL